MLYFPVATEHINPPIVSVFGALSDRALFTAYPFITGMKSISVAKYFLDVMRGRFLLMDSGVYTMIRDEAVGHDITFDYVAKYTDKYIRFIKALGYKDALVEVDCQHFIEPWSRVLDLRKHFINAGLLDQTIFVWHFQDGKEGFEGLLKPDVKRISFSLRDFVRRNLNPSYVLRMLKKYEKEVVGKHIHLLGASTQIRMSDYGDSCSCDTSSWNAMNFFGDLILGGRIIASYRNKKFTAPQYLLDRVDAKMDEMVYIYKHHPEYSRGTKIRRHYLRMAGVGLLATQDYMNNIRIKHAGYNPAVVDPLDFWKN